MNTEHEIKLAGTIGAILVNHGVIDRSAIEDPDGYDGGITKQRVIDATLEIAKLHWPTPHSPTHTDPDSLAAAPASLPQTSAAS